MLVSITLIRAIHLTKCLRLSAGCNVTSSLSKFSALQDKTINNARASYFTTGAQQMKLRGLMCLRLCECVAAASLMST